MLALWCSAWVTEHNMTPFDDNYADRVKHVKSKRALRALEEAERFRETGHLPLAFAAVADSAVEESPEADEAPETPKRRGSGRQAPQSREEKRPKKEKGPSAQELAAKREQERRERRLRVMRHLGLAPPPPPS